MKISIFFFGVLYLSCLNLAMSQENNSFDLQGHRGCRGLMPENTIPAFLKAIDLKVNTLEMDLVITKDKQVLVSHEPFICAEYCLDINGDEIYKSKARALNLYQMSYDEIVKFDCGTKVHPRFPDQMKMEVSKPLLSEVINEVERYTETSRLEPINYNLEIKSVPEEDHLFQPEPTEFSNLVYQALNDVISWERITIQSFDFRILRYFHEHFPNVRLAMLIENKKSINENIETLGFLPEIYSCEYVLLSQDSVDYLHQKGMKVIPWTVNEPTDMERLISWGVDGLITDYPNRYFQINE